jgi:hypothetical protein
MYFDLRFGIHPMYRYELIDFIGSQLTLNLNVMLP